MNKVDNANKTKRCKDISLDYSDRKKQYNEMKELRQMLKVRKEKYNEDSRRQRKQIEENRLRKEANELKNGQYEIIKNVEKMKKWKVKARRLIRKVPKDIFYSKYFNKDA